MSLVSLMYQGEGRFAAVNAHHARRCDDAYGHGEIMDMARVEDRSWKSHQAYFAQIGEAWKNLPERCQLEPYAGHRDHLRKHALIMAGYRADPIAFVMASNAEALRAAPVLRATVKDYCIAPVQGPTVTLFAAKSQSLKAMGRKEFQESKDAVLSWISGEIGVDVSMLRGATENAA